MRSFIQLISLALLAFTGCEEDSSDANDDSVPDCLYSMGVTGPGDGVIAFGDQDVLLTDVMTVSDCEDVWIHALTFAVQGVDGMLPCVSSCKGDSDFLFINGKLDTGIDGFRYPASVELTENYFGDTVLLYEFFDDIPLRFLDGRLQFIADVNGVDAMSIFSEKQFFASLDGVGFSDDAGLLLDHVATSNFSGGVLRITEP